MAILNTRLTTTDNTTVYTSTGNNAITTIVVCNTGSVNLTDETVNSAQLTLNFIPAPIGGGQLPPPDDSNTVVKNLIIPAGETVFFSDEKVILSNGDVINARSSASNLLTITVSILPV